MKLNNTFYRIARMSGRKEPGLHMYRLYDGCQILNELSSATRLMGYHDLDDDQPYIDDYAAALSLVLAGYPDKPFYRDAPDERPYLTSSLYGYVTPQIRGHDRNPFWLPMTLCVNVNWLIDLCFSENEEKQIIRSVQQWIIETHDTGCEVEPQWVEVDDNRQIYSHVVRFRSLRHMAGFRQVFPFPV